MNLNLNRSGENDFIYLVNRVVVTIDDHFMVLNSEGSGELFFKESKSGATTLKELLVENVYEKLHSYVTQSLLVRNKIISKYHFIHLLDQRIALRFIVYPVLNTLSTTAILIEAVPVDENTIIHGKAFSEDISEGSEAKPLEEALQASETKFQAFFSSINDGVFLSENGKITECNDQAQKIFGCRREEIVGKEISTVFP